MPRILAFAGSTRRESFNKRIVTVAAEAARAAGAEVEVVDLKDYALPLFDQDDEANFGKPEAVTRLKEKMVASDGFLIASPEYNGSVSGVLKNAIDWVSRPDEGEPRGGLVAFRGKVVTLMSASPGGLGGLRALAHVRDILTGIGCIVMPQQVAVPAAHEQFDENGALKSEGIRLRLEALGTSLTEFLRRLE